MPKPISLISILFFTLFSTFSPTSNAAWWLMVDPPNDRKKISDYPMEFKLGNFSCGVTKTEFLRGQNDYLFEFRTLYCQTANDTMVSVQANCRHPEYVEQQIQITKGTAKFFPVLQCGPAEINQ